MLLICFSAISYTNVVDLYMLSDILVLLICNVVDLYICLKMSAAVIRSTFTYAAIFLDPFIRRKWKNPDSMSLILSRQVTD